MRVMVRVGARFEGLEVRVRVRGEGVRVRLGVRVTWHEMVRGEG